MGADTVRLETVAGRTDRPIPGQADVRLVVVVLCQGARCVFLLDHSVRPAAAVSSGLVIGHRAGVVARSRLGSATRVDAVSDHCAGVLGWMFLLLWNTFSGSYLAFTSASRQ